MILLDLFRGHGVDAASEPGGVVFPGRGLRACATIGRAVTNGAMQTVQLDVRFEVEPGRYLVESFAGIGPARDRALADAWEEFALNSLHPILAAFFRPDDPQVDHDRWNVGGRARRVTIGGMRTRGTPPAEGGPPVAWFGPFQAAIEARPLPPGTHWIRLYYAQMESKPTVCEVLLDNEPWEEVRAEMAAIDWPSGDAFYSVRVFLILQDEVDTPRATAASVQPLEMAELVARAVTVFAANPDADDDALIAALVRMAFPSDLALRMVEFMPLAFARPMLESIGVRFAEEYIRLDSKRREVHRARLIDEPVYREALALAPTVRPELPVYLSVAGRSAELHAVNSATQAGSKPHDLKFSPPKLLAQAAKGKPFWKFWA